MLSRNTPVALVVGAAGFVGSCLTEKLLSKAIQVVGIDDLSSGHKENLNEATKAKYFHFLHQDAEKPYQLTLPRLDYAYFVLAVNNDNEYLTALKTFLEFCRQFKPKIALVSTIEVYDHHKSSSKIFQQAEKFLAHYAKDNQLNARIIRLSSLYGPRMRFNDDDPMSRLIQASLQSELQTQSLSLDFTTRSLYIDDAVGLLIKAVFIGGTSHKIYDGALGNPLKISEVGQVLMDPLWYESRNFIPTELPPWPTPNLERTQKELNWKSLTPFVQSLKETIHYFKDKPHLYPKTTETEVVEIAKMAVPVSADIEEVQKKSEKGRELFTKNSFNLMWLKKYRTLIFALILIFAGLIYPLFTLLAGGLSVRSHIKASEQALQIGDFPKAQIEIKSAKAGVDQLVGLLGSLKLMEKIPPLASTYQNSIELVGLLSQAIQASDHAIKGTGALYQTAKAVSGSETGEIKSLLDQGRVELSAADRDFSQIRAQLDDPWFQSAVPRLLRSRAEDLRSRVVNFQEIISRARAVAYILPEVLALDGKKSYLVLLQNNMELRPGGGFIGSYAQIDFDHGKLAKIKVEDIYSLDGQLKDHVEPPAEIKKDLGQKNWYLRDSNMEPDFPTNAKLADWFYRREAGVQVAGIISMDLSAAQKLLEATGPLNLADYAETVDNNNLFEKAIAHAEVSFFSGSQAKKNFLSALETELFNNLFFLPKQNWPGIIKAVGQSLDEKHIMIYLSDPALFSYVTSQGWAGLLPRPAKIPNAVGERDEFLAISEANLGANKSNYYLERSGELQTRIGKDGQIEHTLTLHYANQSPTDIWPGGQYKNRLKVYLPSGTKLIKASWGKDDIIKNVSSFLEYGRAGYSMLLLLQPKERKELVLEYQDAQLLVADGGRATLRQSFIKQPGTLNDKFIYTLNYALNFTPTSQDAEGRQEIQFVTDLSQDRSFEVVFQKSK